ncbi:SMI1/KNR4 family protein [uncultured Flavobacterium sp.]|uniref:SMI1/KNR4 family protein n=1 Tax=uncultured Flavobacterium sp. TaxID=165435 RepID=UPI003082143D
MNDKLTIRLSEAFKSKLDIFDTFMNDGANDKEIVDLEKSLNQILPSSYIDLLKTYNGEKKSVGFMGGFGFLGTQEIVLHWDFFKIGINEREPDSVYQKDKIKNELFSIKRIPFAHDGSGNFLCIDYDPGVEGKNGQILYLPTGDPEPVSVIADNFDEFLSFLIDAVTTEKLKLTDERDEWDEEDWEKADIYFEHLWKDDWTDIADEYNLKQANN